MQERFKVVGRSGDAVGEGDCFVTPAAVEGISVLFKTSLPRSPVGSSVPRTRHIRERSDPKPQPNAFRHLLAITPRAGVSLSYPSFSSSPSFRGVRAPRGTIDTGGPHRPPEITPSLPPRGHPGE